MPSASNGSSGVAAHGLTWGSEPRRVGVADTEAPDSGAARSICWRDFVASSDEHSSRVADVNVQPCRSLTLFVRLIVPARARVPPVGDVDGFNTGFGSTRRRFSVPHSPVTSHWPSGEIAANE